MLTDNFDVEIEAADGHVVRATHRSVAAPVATVLMVHGITGTRHERGYYDDTGDELQRRDVASLAIDYRGHGESILGMDQLSLSGMMLDVDASWNYLREAHPDDTVVRIITGCSFGAGVCLLYALGTGSVDNTLLTMPVLSYIDDITRVNPTWKSDVGNGFVGYDTERLSTNLVPELYFFDDLIERSNYSKPFTILHGTADSDVPFAESTAFCERHRGGTVIPVDGVDHGWAAPGDLVRATEQSEVNQQVAIAKTLEIIEGWLK